MLTCLMILETVAKRRERERVEEIRIKEEYLKNKADKAEQGMQKRICTSNYSYDFMVFKKKF